MGGNFWGGGREGRVLVLEQGFMRARRGKPIHGVELFRLNLIREMGELGIDVTVACQSWWAQQIRKRAPNARVLPLGGVMKVVGTGVRAAIAARKGKPFDVVLIGDPGAGMIPGMIAARLLRLAPRHVVFAHRVPKRLPTRVARAIGADVVANSEVVAQHYRRAGAPTRIMYGVPNAELFFPHDVPRDGELINLCLIARLPGHDKGLDVALEAFNQLEPGVAQRCRLHLVAFATPPKYDNPRIVAHPWMPLEDVAKLLREMDILLALSEHETFSQAIVQGMLTGLPVIATPIPVYVEKLDPLQQGGGGVVVSHIKAADEVAHAIEALARDEGKRRALGAEGRRVAERRFAWNTKRFVGEILLPANQTTDAG